MILVYQSQNGVRPMILNIRQAAAYLGIGVDTLYLVCEGKTKHKIPCFKIGNRWKFKKDVLDKWMDERIAEHMESSSQNGNRLSR